jgi:hypothetical protein
MRLLDRFTPTDALNTWRGIASRYGGTATIHHAGLLITFVEGDRS